MFEHIKCVVVGDGAVGKTALLMSYSKNSFPTNYNPTVFDNYEVTLMVEGRPITLGLWDTAGQECYDRLRVLSYTDADVFVLCFDINNIDSLVNIWEKWYHEITHHCPNSPIVLVGTKSDLREEWSPPVTVHGGDKMQELGTRSLNNNNKRTTVAQGWAMAKQIKAHTFLECSAMTKQGVNDVFYEVILAALHPVKKEAPRKRCFIL